MFRLMTGEKNEPAIVELDDCPDTDIVEIVSLGPGKLNEAEHRQVQEEGISWDLPSVTEENRKWLAQCILQHAVRLSYDFSYPIVCNSKFCLMIKLF
ncbi:hypothetical protein AOLI_G00241480 [Acnodon oligacanthus]